MNTIRIYLAESGRIAELKKDFPLYQGQFQNKLLNIYVPTSLLAPSFTTQDQEGQVLENYVATTAVKIGMTYTTRSGLIKVSQNYYMRYLKRMVYQGVEYAMYERKLPQEFTLYAGQGANAPNLIANVVNIQTDTDPPVVLNITTSQSCSLDVMPSALLDNDGVVEPSEMELLQARVNELETLFPLKQNVTDEALETTSKKVVGAINENKRRIDENAVQIEANTEDIATNRNDIDHLLQNITYTEDYIGQMSGSILPTSEQLNAFVLANTSPSREPKNADTIFFILNVEGDTDKTYKYIYARSGWEGYEIPAVESASNGTKGILEGTYAIGSTNTTLVDISGGQILNIYIKDNIGTYRNIREYANSLNTEIYDIINGFTVVGEAMKSLEDGVGNNIVNTYLTKAQGVTKDQMQDYALPREFNDTFFVVKNGYSKTVPTEPESGIQYTAYSNQVGETRFATARMTVGADFELSIKNGYSNSFYISARNDEVVSFRLTTTWAKVGDPYTTLRVELSTPISLVHGEIQKVEFGGPFTGLGESVIHVGEGDIIMQQLDIIRNTSTTNGFDLYSNEVYPSTFNLTTQSYSLASTGQDIGRVIFLGADGVIEGGRVVFEVQNAEAFLEFRTNQREFLFTGHLPIVGVLDRDLPIAITFGDTTYQVYSFMDGGDAPITIGDLMSVGSYSANIGYSFFSKMIFLETSDIIGFAIEPPTLTAGQLMEIVEDTDGVVVSLDPTGTMLQLQLNATITNKLARTLVTPLSAPATIELVAIDDNNSQTMLGLGSGLYIANGMLNVNGGGGGGGTTNYADLDNKPVLNTNNTASQTPNANEVLNGTINLHKIAKTGNLADLNGANTLATTSMLPTVTIMGV